MLTGCTVRGSPPNIPSELEFAAIFVAGGAARVRALGRGMLQCGNTRALSFAKTRSPRFVWSLSARTLPLFLPFRCNKGRQAAASGGTKRTSEIAGFYE